MVFNVRAEPTGVNEFSETSRTYGLAPLDEPGRLCCVL